MNNNNKLRKSRRLKMIKRKRRRMISLLFLLLIIFAIIVVVIVSISQSLSREDNPDNKAIPPPVKALRTVEDQGARGKFISAKPTTSKPLPKSSAVTDAYFDDVLFIGDSRTQALQLYSGLENTTFYASKGLNVKTIFSTASVPQNGSKITIIEALKHNKFGKVYIMFGINELGWPSKSTFIDLYGKIIDEVKKTQPNATIYIQSILPVSAEKSSTSPVFKNESIVSCNELIFKMATEKNVYYVDLDEFAKDKSGALYADAGTDGIHLNKNYCLKWIECLKTHTIENWGK